LICGKLRRGAAALLLAAAALSGCGETGSAPPPDLPPETFSPAPGAASTPTPAPTAAPVTDVEAAFSPVTRVETAPWILQGEEQNRLSVCWMGKKVDEPPWVWFGPDPGDGRLPPEAERVEAESTLLSGPAAAHHPWFYRAELSLAPGTRYVYGLSQGETPPSVLYPLCTDTNGTYSFACLSDTHLVNRKQCAAAEAALELAMKEKLSEGDALDGIFHLGDILDQPGMSLGLFTDNVPALRSFPLTAVAGNHDDVRSLRAYFPMPHAGKDTGDFWYLRDRVLVIGLNMEDRRYENHADHVRAAVASAGAHDWTVVLIHCSLRGNGSHSRDRQVVNLRLFLEPVFTELDVDLVISGHDHEYDRAQLLGAEGPVPGGEGTELNKRPGQVLYIAAPTSTGVKYFRRNREVDCPMAAEGLEREPGIVLVDAAPEEIRVRVYGTESGPIDNVVLRRSAG